MEDNGKSNFEPPTLDVEHELPTTGTEEPAGQEIERLKAERDSLFERLARLQAEFENYRKRQWREQQEFRDYALADALKSLLPILDSFDRALASDGAGGEFRAGIELIHRQFEDTLAKLGVTPVRAQGERFDPNLHQAVQMVETTEAEDNHVIEELQRGYKIKERLLRPAMVRVARNPGK
jgi:molecular chaperone GrpE